VTNKKKKRKAFNTQIQIRRVLKGKLGKPRHSCSVYRSTDGQRISEVVSLLRLSKGDLKGETESEIVAVHDQALQTKYHVTKILQRKTDSKCRLCQEFAETVGKQYKQSHF